MFRKMSFYFLVLLVLLPQTLAASCPTVNYRLTLTSLVSPTLIPSAPDNLFFSPVTAFTHSRRFSSLVRYGYASSAIQLIAEKGDNSELLAELRSDSAKPFVKSIATSPAVQAGEVVHLDVSVDCHMPFLTAVSMVAPSPDWMIAIANMDLRDNGVFVPRRDGMLKIYDAGTDSGMTFMAPDSGTDPRENIAPLLMFDEPYVAKYSIVRVASGCPKATYELSVRNVWTTERFGSVPEGSVLSPLTAVSHTRRFSPFVLYGYATKGVEAIAERGDNSVMLEELRSAAAKPFVKTIAAADGPVKQGETFSVRLEVDCETSRVSFISMVAPSPDWIVAKANMDLFEDGAFVPRRMGVLRVYDAGTDSGETVSAEDEDTKPRENIAPLMGEPFRGRHAAWYVIRKVA